MKMSPIKSLTIIIIISLISNLCTKDEDIMYTDQITGYVQKGPYTPGTPVGLSELNSYLANDDQGIPIDTLITMDNGYFILKDFKLTHRYVLLHSGGFYYSEILGDISPFALDLYGLADIKNSTTVNVNILTHLERMRVTYLVGQGYGFRKAKTTAQKELLAIFGFQLQNMDNSEFLDISVDKEENAILLAISIIFESYEMANLNLSSILNDIIFDMEMDGILDDTTIVPRLRSCTISLDLPTIRSNIETKYKSLGINTKIPSFENYINEFLNFSLPSKK
jgi:hypothetical protein